MKKLFIDTNVALDMLQDRRPFSFDALEIFALSEQSTIELYLSTDSLSTIFYVVEKNSGASVAREAVSKLLDYVILAALDEEAVLKGMLLDFADIEDAFIASVAQRVEVDAIITRDKKDFAKSPVVALTPREFLAALIATDNNKLHIES